MEILMIGPGEPSRQNSGLGVACRHIERELAKKIGLKIFSPEAINDRSQDGESPEQSYRIQRDEKLTNSRQLNADIVHIEVSSKLDPYFYLSHSDQEITKEQQSEIQQSLEQYTQQLIIQGEKVDFDLIYAHDWMSIAAAMALREKFNKPLVLHIHALDYDRTGKKTNSWLYQLEKKGLDAADAIIAVSQYHADIIAKNYDVNKSKIHVVHHGVNPVETEKFSSPFDEPIVLFAGRLCDQKGAMLFVETAKILEAKNEKLRFVMAGEGELLPALINKCMEDNMMKKFHFTGHLNQSELFSLMSDSAAFVMPSTSDPFGLTALEAANVGVPVVLSDRCGVKEVLPQADLVSKDDPKIYAQRIIKLLQNKEDCKKKVAENKNALKDKTWARTADKIVKIFENSI